MIASIRVILFILATVLFLAATFFGPMDHAPRLRLVAAGLLAFSLAFIFNGS